MTNLENHGDVSPIPEAEGWLYRYPKTRMWLYGVIAAALAIVAGWQGFEFVTTQQWLNLAVALLNIGGTVSSAVAMTNLRK